MGYSLALEQTWQEALSAYLSSDNFQDTTNQVRKAYLNTTTYPKIENVFRAFDLTPFDQVRVVILGQDPYINPGQAMGLSFSVPIGEKTPPSLQNIYKEIKSDLGHPSVCAPNGDLTAWAKQGVLLLNTTLTVEAGLSNSHGNYGWDIMTDEVIKQLSLQRNNLVFMLWGSNARSKTQFIDSNKHLILEAPHPSPLSAHKGFFGCRHFSQTNEYLMSLGQPPIEW